jgi:uncharacterized protein (TIGR02270 family)
MAMDGPPMSVKAEPFPHLIEESFDESSFLWSRWEADLSSISRNLSEVWTWTEDRLGGALDGVRLAPEATLERLTQAALVAGQSAGLTVCGHVLADSAAANAQQLLGEALRNAKGPALKSLLRGVETAHLDGRFAPVAKILSRESPEHAAALARLKAFRRASLGEELTTAFESQDMDLQIEALRAARALPSPYAAAWVETGLKHGQLAARVAAMETGIRQQVPNAWGAALATVRQADAQSAVLLPLVAMLGSEAEQEIIYAALGKPALQRWGIWALGTIGSRKAAEHCLLAMKRPKLARMAGEAYCAITGAELARDKLVLPEPDEPTPDFAADNLDADLVPTREQQWPLPDPDAVQRHWTSCAARIQDGARYIRGRPVSLNALADAIQSAPMLRRSDYAYELYVRTQGKYDVETRATRQVQRLMMTKGTSHLAEGPAP